eukprot:ctg_196.g64
MTPRASARGRVGSIGAGAINGRDDAEAFFVEHSTRTTQVGGVWRVVRNGQRDPWQIEYDATLRMSSRLSHGVCASEIGHCQLRRNEHTVQKRCAWPRLPCRNPSCRHTHTLQRGENAVCNRLLIVGRPMSITHSDGPVGVVVCREEQQQE